MKDKEQLFTQQAEFLLTILNQQRHDWLNHFQVLLGYLKLGRPEKGEEYLKRVTEDAHKESMIARLQCPPLSVYFLTYNALHRELKLEVEVCNEIDLSTVKMESHAFCQLVIDYVNVIESHVKKCEFECSNLLISLFSQENYVRIKFDLAGNLSTSAQVEMEKLLLRSTEVGALVCESIHTDDEWILELSFPSMKR